MIDRCFIRLILVVLFWLVWLLISKNICLQLYFLISLDLMNLFSSMTRHVWSLSWIGDLFWLVWLVFMSRCWYMCNVIFLYHFCFPLYFVYVVMNRCWHVCYVIFLYHFYFPLYFLHVVMNRCCHVCYVILFYHY